MSIAQTHLDIARERFLEMLAQHPNADVQGAAVAAIEQADAFMHAYRVLVPAESAPPAKLKGCRACYGSGGKHGDPCKSCAGTGKVTA